MIELNVRSPSDSSIHDHVYKIFPNDLNSHNTVFGGVIMSIADRLALVVAERHSGSSCVTASVDDMHFLDAAKGGDTLLFKACINRAWGSSMEIGIHVDAENSYNRETRNILSAYFTFVALDINNKPCKVPALLPDTDEQKIRYEQAGMRRQLRLEKASRLKGLRNI